MSRGLPRKPLVVFNGGGLDTKTDPRIVPSGSLLEIENMYMLKTGELRLRNGFAALSATKTVGNIDSIATLPGGILSGLAGNLLAGGRPWKTPVKYVPSGGALPSGWYANTLTPFLPFPLASVALKGVEAVAFTASTTQGPDLLDPDMGIANGVTLTTWYETGATTTFRTQYRNAAGQMRAGNGISTTNGRPPVVVCGGAGANAYLGGIFCDNAGVPSLKFFGNDLTNYTDPVSTLVLNGVNAAQPWIDAKVLNDGTNNLMYVAYRANAGGVSVLVYNLATSAITAGPTNFAALDASFCLGWLDDQNGTGAMYLATVGSANGACVHQFSGTTKNYSATVDAAATARVRNVTGHTTSATGNDIAIFWDVDSGFSISSDMYVRRGTWNGAAATASNWPCQAGIYSRTFKAADGNYYFIGSFDSQVQPAYSVIGCDTYVGTTSPQSLAQIMPGYAGGRRSVKSSIASVVQNGTASCVPLPRATKVIESAFASTALRAIMQAQISFSAVPRRPRELGGTVFYPGGIVSRDDGKTMSWAVFPYYFEAPVLGSVAGGALTALGDYSYCTVLKRIDAAGRISRSAPSVPTAVTLPAGNQTINVTYRLPQLLPDSADRFAVEIYRAGPAGAGNTTFNKVNEASVSTGGGGAPTNTFVDTVPDNVAVLGEILYTTGNVLENLVSPSCTLLEVCGNRVGIVSAESPDEFWPSKEYKAGFGLGFHPDLAIKVSGDGYGGMTALAAMDGRWILFKSSAIYVISGDGPNDSGQGSFGAPQAVSLSVGTVLPGSVVATPDGIMFQGAAGIYLLDRGLGLTYVGAPVEQYTLAANVVDASLVSGVTQVRFVQASGRCLVWDYHHKRWYTFLLRVSGSTIVGCADHPSGWCYALANGTVMQETAGVYSDVNGTSTAIVPRVGFPAFALGGIAGYERFYGVDILGEFVGNHTLAVDFEYDYAGAVSETRTMAITAGPYRYEILPATQKVTSVKITLRTSVQAAGSGAFRLTGLTLWVGMKKGSAFTSGRRFQ